MHIEKIEGMFSVCRAEDLSAAPLEDDFCFAEKTDREYSLVCRQEHVPANALKREDGWRMLRISGTLDFSLVGILSRVALRLAEEGISIFALSTFDTDYIMVKSDRFEKAAELAEEALCSC